MCFSPKAATTTPIKLMSPTLAYPLAVRHNIMRTSGPNSQIPAPRLLSELFFRRSLWPSSMDEKEQDDILKALLAPVKNSGLSSHFGRDRMQTGWLSTVGR